MKSNMSKIMQWHTKIAYRLVVGVSLWMVLVGCSVSGVQSIYTIPQYNPTGSISPIPSLTTSAAPKAASLPVNDGPTRITAQNAADVTQLARFGQGMVNGEPFYSLDGELLVIPTSVGIDLYEAATLHKLSSIPALSDGDLTLVPAYPRLVALSPDRRLLAANLQAINFSPGGDLQEEDIQPIIYLWDVTTGSVVSKIPLGSETTLADLTFSPDGLHLAAGFDAGNIQLWSVTNSEEGFSLNGSELEFSPDGKLIATMPSNAGGDQHIYLYNMEDGSLLRQWEGQRAIYSRDGLLAIESNGVVRVMDIETGIAYRAFNGKSAAFSADGQILALLHQEQVKLYRLADRKLLQTMEGNFETVSKMQFAPNGLSLAIIGDAPMCPNCMPVPQAALWQISNNTPIFPEIQHPLGFTYAPHEGYLVIWASAGIHILNPANTSPVTVFDEYSASVDGIAFSPDEQTLATNSGQPHLSVRFWQMGDERLDKLLETPQNPGYGYSKVTFSPDGRVLWAQGNFWNIRGGEQLNRLEDILKSEAPPYVPSSIAFSPDGSLMAIGYLAGDLQLWDLREEKLIRRLEGYQGEVVDLAFSPDEKTLAAVYGYPDIAIQFWKIPECERLFTIQGVGWTHVFTQAVFAPDGRTLASVAKNEDGMDLGSVELWDAFTGKRLYQLDVMGVLSVAFSQDGEIITTGGYDHTVRLWLAVDGTILKILPGHGDYVSDLAFSPSGEVLASGSNDGTVILWGVH